MHTTVESVHKDDVENVIQLIIETHCEHVINKLRFQVFDDKINCQDIVIFYKNVIKRALV